MTIRKSAKLLRRERNELAVPVANYFGNSVIEFAFKRASFDVVSFDHNKNVWKIVECKLASRLTSIGATFGQLLAYTALISGNGWAFLESLHEQWGKSIPLATLKAMLSRSKVIPVEFYVAFRKDDISDKKQFLAWAHENFMNKKIGVLIVDRGRCDTLMPSQISEIPITTSFSKISEVMDEINNLGKQEKTLSEAQCAVKNRYIQYHFGNSKIHFEVWFHARMKAVEIALHIESNPSRNKRIFQLLRKNRSLLKKRLPNMRIEPWKKVWARVYERMYWNGILSSINEPMLEEIISKLSDYVRTLKPFLDKHNWGKAPGSTQKEIVRRFIMGDGTKRREVTSEQLFRYVKKLPEFQNFGNENWVRGHAVWKAKLLCEADSEHFVRIDKRRFCYIP